MLLPWLSANELEEVQRNEDDNLLRYYLLFEDNGPVARVMAFLFKLLFGRMDLREKKAMRAELYFPELGMSFAQYEKVITKEKTKKNGIFRSEVSSYGVYHVYKLLKYACGLAPPYDVRWTAHCNSKEKASLEHKFFILNDMRVSLCEWGSIRMAHEQLRFEIVGQIVDIFMFAFAKVSEMTGEDLNQELEEGISSVKTILNLTIHPKEKHEYAKDLYSMQYETCAAQFLVTMKVPDKYVTAKYKDLRTALNGPGKTADVVKKVERMEVFRCGRKICNDLDWESLDFHLSDCPFQVYSTIKEMNTDLEVFPELLLIHKLPDGSLPRVIILTGDPGTGKTSVVSYCVNHRVNKHEDLIGILDFDSVFLFPMSKCVTSVKDFLRYDVAPTTHKFDDNLPLSTYRRKKVIFLLDGFEDGNKNCLELFESVMQKLPNARFLITVRSANYRSTWDTIATNLKRIHKKEEPSILSLYMAGIATRNIDEYVFKILRGLASKTDIRTRLWVYMKVFLTQVDFEKRAKYWTPCGIRLMYIVWAYELFFSKAEDL